MFNYYSKYLFILKKNDYVFFIKVRLVAFIADTSR